MSVAYSHQIYNFILPSIKENSYINLGDLVRSLLTRGSQPAIDYSYTLLHSLMKAVDGNVGEYCY